MNSEKLKKLNYLKSNVNFVIINLFLDAKNVIIIYVRDAKSNI